MNGNRMKELRTMEGLTQADVVKQLGGGMTPQAVSKWETHGDKEINIHANYWEKLAIILNCDIEEFYPKQAERTTSNVATASGGASITQAGRDISGSDDEGLRLSPKERMAILMARRYGEWMLDQLIENAREIREKFEKR